MEMRRSLIKRSVPRLMSPSARSARLWISRSAGKWNPPSMMKDAQADATYSESELVPIL